MGRLQTGQRWARYVGAVVLGVIALFLSLHAPAGQSPMPTVHHDGGFLHPVAGVDESVSVAPAIVNPRRIKLGSASSFRQATMGPGFTAAKSSNHRAADPVCQRTSLDPTGRKGSGRAPMSRATAGGSQGSDVSVSTDRTLRRSGPSVQSASAVAFREKYWWVAVLVSLITVLAGMLGWLRRRRRQRDPYGLELSLISADGHVLSQHMAGHGHKGWYEFTISDIQRSPRIERRLRGPYAVQRSSNGGVLIRKGSNLIPLPIRGVAKLTDTLALGVDFPTLSPKSRASRSAPGKTPYASHTPPGPSTGSDDDEWPESPFSRYE